MEQDYCIRGVALNNQVRFFIANTKNIVEEAMKRYNLTPLSAAALGRTLTAASMMGMNLKGDDTLTITFKGDGPLGNVVARSNSLGEVKGYCDNPEVDLPVKENGKIDVSGGIGFGTLYIAKDMGLKDPYVGTVPIVSGEIGEDLTEYYYSSEQTLSAVGLGVLVDVDYTIIAAGGFIIQLMPEAGNETGMLLEKRIGLISSISSYFIDNTPEDLVKLFFGEDYKILDNKEINFKCHCNKDNFAVALLTLGKDELEKLAQDKEIEVVCQFCNEKYIFDKDEIKHLIANN